MYPRKLTRQVISNLDYPVVETRHGKLRGSEVEGAFIFRGIEYANAVRFHMPQEPKSWDGIKPAVAYGPVCSEFSTLIPRDAYTVPHFWYPQSENCHYLNIWTQSIDQNAKRPVIVWIHGGGFFHGSAMEIFSYDGENLSAFGDVVVVAVNHRVNALGYLDLSGFGDEYVNSCNIGMADLVKALEWIQCNISAFGGNPGNVTIVGQSGGGAKVETLLQMPAADGLYHKACIHSGGAEPHDLLHEEAGLIADLIIGFLGLTGDKIKEIETVPFFMLAKAGNHATEYFKNELGKRLRWGPLADGKYYMGHPSTVGFREETKNIPMLVGSCMGEFETVDVDPKRYEDGSSAFWSNAITKRRFYEKFGVDAKSIEEVYRKTYPGRRIADAIYIESIRRPDHVRFSRLRAEAGCADVYNWYLAIELPCEGGSTAWHNADEAFLFHNASHIESTYIPGVTDKLQDIFAGAWVTFAKTGNPNHKGMPEWKPVDPKDDKTATMVFDSKCEMRYGHDSELMELLKKHNIKSSGPLLGYGGGPRHNV